MRKVALLPCLALTLGLLVFSGKANATPPETTTPPPTSTPPTSTTSTGTSALIVSPTQGQENNSSVTTTGSTLFNASQTVFNVSGNKAEFGENGCAFPVPLLNAAANYGSSSSDFSSLSGFNVSVGATFPLNGKIAPLCVEASRIRNALLTTRSLAEKNKVEADALGFCYNLRRLALDSRANVIILPAYCPVALTALPTAPAPQTGVVNTPTTVKPIPVQQAPRPQTPANPVVNGGF
jgi:hypothetical protein